MPGGEARLQNGFSRQMQRSFSQRFLEMDVNETLPTPPVRRRGASVGYIKRVLRKISDFNRHVAQHKERFYPRKDLTEERGELELIEIQFGQTLTAIYGLYDVASSAPDASDLLQSLDRQIKLMTSEFFDLVLNQPGHSFAQKLETFRIRSIDILRMHQIQPPAFRLSRIDLQIHDLQRIESKLEIPYSMPAFGYAWCRRSPQSWGVDKAEEKVQEEPSEALSVLSPHSLEVIAEWKADLLRLRNELTSDLLQMYRDNIIWHSKCLSWVTGPVEKNLIRPYYFRLREYYLLRVSSCTNHPKPIFGRV